MTPVSTSNIKLYSKENCSKNNVSKNLKSKTPQTKIRLKLIVTFKKNK